MHTYNSSIPEAKAEELKVQATWATYQVQDQPVLTQEGLCLKEWAAAISCSFIRSIH